MRCKLFLAFAPVLLIAAHAADNAPAPAKLNFPNVGFRINALDEPAAEGTNTCLVMALPASQGFVANINVNVQHYDKTMADYIELSKKQFSTMGFKLLSEKTPAENEWTIEYTGDLQGRKMHWYARMVLFKGQVYQATGSALEGQWSALSEKLKDCVTSLEIPAKTTPASK